MAVAAGVEDQVMWWTPRHAYIEKMRTAMGPSATLSWKVEQPTVTPLEVFPADIASISPVNINAALVLQMHAAGIEVQARSANPNQIQAMVNEGVDSALTNQAELVKC